MIYRILFIILFSMIFNQRNIETKEFIFYKNENISQIDISSFIDNMEGNYKVVVSDVENIDYKRHKDVIIDVCDVDFSIYLPLEVKTDSKKTIFPKKNNNSINIKKCENLIIEDKSLIINEENYIINITDDKYKYLTCEIVFWITGFFKDTVKLNSNDSGILREWHGNNRLHLEYNFKNGKKNGIQKRWYENGQQEILYHYKNNKLDGMQKSWYPNGVMKSKMFYKSDLKNGDFREWYDNGQLKYYKIFEDDILLTIVESYDYNGASN